MNARNKQLLARKLVEVSEIVKSKYYEKEKEYLCEPLSRWNYVSVWSLCILAFPVLVGVLFVLLWKDIPLLFRLLFLLLYAIGAYQVAIRLVLPAYAVVTNLGIYICLFTPRKRVYRILFSEIKSMRVRKLLFSREQTRICFLKNKLTFPNSPAWKMFLFKFKDIKTIGEIDYPFFYTYTPPFLQLVGKKGGKLQQTIEDVIRNKKLSIRRK